METGGGTHGVLRHGLMFFSMTIAICVAALALPGVPGHVAANTLAVTDCGDSGTNTLRGLIAAAGTGATIVYDRDCMTTLASTLETGTSLMIDGNGHAVVLDGHHAVRVFLVDGGATVALNALTIANGSVSSNGGGIYNAGTLTVTNSTLSGNAANGGEFGGGIVNFGTLTVTNSTLSGNTAGQSGGGIANFGGTATMTNVTLSGNSAGDGGGGIAAFGGTMTLTNTIIANSTGGDCSLGAGTINADSHDLADDGSCISPTQTTSTAINLQPLANNGGPTQTMALVPGSVAIDAGNNAAVANPPFPAPPFTDQRGAGFARIVNTTVDIGAFESGGFTLTKQHDGQSTTINAAFASPLAVTVAPSNAGEPVNGGQVTFTIQPGTGGASATFGTATGCTVSGGNLNAVCTVSGGTATPPTLTANGTLGTFTVAAKAAGAATQTFTLKNIGPATHFAVSAPPSATAGVAFNITVTALDVNNDTAIGYSGTMQLTSSDPQAVLPANYSFTTGAGTDNGLHIFAITLRTAGTRTITATDTSSGTTGTSNTIAVAVAAPASITADPATTPQSAQVGTAFARPLMAIVTDAFGNPVSGVSVTFTAPGGGASGTFAGGVTTATTDTSGAATAPAFTANGTAGGYTVAASVPGVAAPAPFALTNTAGAAASIVAAAGGGQTAVGNSAFAASLQAKVTDAGGNPVSGVSVTFTAPSSGASGTFATTGTNTATATTDASGIAPAPTFTANTTAGADTVTANLTSGPLATPATFSLTNTHGAVTQVTITGAPSSGTPVKIGQTLQLTATATLTDRTTEDVTAQVTWSSSNTNVATVGLHTGLVTFVGPGPVTIMVTLVTTSGEVGGQATVTGTVQVTVAEGTALGIAPAPQPSGRPAGGTSGPTAAPVPTPKPIPSGR